MFKSVQGKNTFYIIAVITIFFLILLFVNYLVLKDFSIDHAERTSSLILSSADSQLEIIFNEIEALINSLSTVRAVREVDIEDMSELFIKNVLVRDDSVRALYLGTEDGKMFEWGVGAGFTNYTPVFPDNYDPRIRPWYKQAVEDDIYGLTSPYIFASIEALGITAVKPVKDKGELVGVIGLDLILHGLDNLVSSLHIPMGGRVILLNQELEMLVNQFSPTTGPVTELNIFPYPELVDQHGGVTIKKVFGDLYMTSSVENAATGWTMLLFLPYQEIMDFSQSTIIVIIIFDLLLMFLLGSLIAFTTRTLVTHPLDKIISVFHQFERGDTGARIPELPGQEFSLIARLFNRLSDLSAESSQRMEKKVEQRTRAIIRLQKENVRLRIIEEKERIYGNLHDSLGACLTSINISNHVAKSVVDRDENSILREMLDRIEKNTGQGILELKEILAADKNSIISVRVFTVFLDGIIREKLALKNISLEIQGESSNVSMLEPEFTAELEKIMLELVSNTMRHSGAKKVTVSIDMNQQQMLLNYSDDGVGFVLKEELKNGFGLQGMFNRTERVDGILKVISKPGRGSSFAFRFRISE